MLVKALTARLMPSLQLPTGHPDAFDGLQAEHSGLHVYIVFSFCMYADAVRIPVSLILRIDNCKHL